MKSAALSPGIAVKCKTPVILKVINLASGIATSQCRLLVPTLMTLNLMSGYWINAICNNPGLNLSDAHARFGLSPTIPRDTGVRRWSTAR